MKAYGFSLLEIIIVICLLSLLTAISAPSIFHLAKLTKNKNFTFSLKNWLESLNATSIVLKEKIYIEKQPDKLSAYVNNKFKKAFLTPKNLTLSLSPSVLKFYGNTTVSPANLRIEDKHTICILRISLRGRITQECALK